MLRRIFLTLLTLVSFTAAFAADPVPAQKKTYELEKMVVTASRGGAQNILEVPQSVTAISDATIAATVKTNLNDVLQEIPGVGFAPTGGGDSSNRNSDYWNSGFSLRGLGGQRVLVLTDGIRQSGQGIGYGGGNLALYDLASVERVELLKGPASVLYGTDAFGGVIQVFSREPAERDSFGMNARKRISFDGSRNVATEGGFVDVGDKNWGLVMNASYTNANLPSLPNGAVAEGGDYRKASGSMKFVLRPTENSQLKILANVLTAHDISIFDDSVYGPGGIGAFYFKIPLYQRRLVGAEYSQTNVSERIKSWKIALYNQEIRRKFTHATPKMSFPGGPPVTVTDLVKTDDTVRTTELQPQIVFDFEPHTLTVGGDLGFDTTYLPEVSSLTGYKLKADAAQTRAGLYAEDRWQLAAKHILTLGARYDRFSLSDNLAGHDADAGDASGSAGYTYLLTPHTSLYATAATGFRSPDLDERYQDTVMQFFNQQVTVAGNPSLKPERSFSLDLGLKHQSECGDFEFSGYYNTVDNFIGLVQQGAPVSLGSGRTAVVKQHMNIGSADFFGFEAGWKTARASSWRNYFNVSRTWTDSQDVVALTNFVFGYGFGYRFTGLSSPFKAITPSVTGRYSLGSHDTVDGVYFPSFNVTDVQFAFELATPHNTRTQLLIGVKNIFNTLYSQPFYDQPQAGRGIFTALQVDF